MRYTRQLLFSSETQKLELLNTPLCKLGLKLDGSRLGSAVRTARDDMRRVGINKLEPLYYLSTGYGTVEGTTNIALGFYDAIPLLRELNLEFRHWQYTEDQVLDTVRHEIGHAFCYAYKLYRRPDFRKAFKVKGNFYKTYPVTNRYVRRANPWSRDFVNPSGDHYAQKHPDDDFAETFLVWMSPDYDWEEAYRNYPGALKKLEYVDTVVRELRNQDPLVGADYGQVIESVDDLTMTVAQFMRARTTKYRRAATGFVDPDLRRLFRHLPTRGNNQKAYTPAATFVRKNRQAISTRVSTWVGVEPFVAKDLIDKCSLRCEALDLWLRKDEREKKLIELTSYISMRCAWYAVANDYRGNNHRH